MSVQSDFKDAKIAVEYISKKENVITLHKWVEKLNKR